jgi:hypothetical protein
MRRAALLLLTCLFPATRALAAQRLPSSGWSLAELAQAAPSRTAVHLAEDDLDTPKLVFGGVIGGAAGLVAGAIVMRDGSCNELDCFAPAFYAGLAGESLGVPLGVHLANGGSGKYGPALAASLAIGGLGLGGALLAGEPRLLLAIPVLQIASSIHFERSSARDRP